jgi:site-specific recombinase XerD
VLYKRGRVWWSRIEWKRQILARTLRTRNKNTAIQIEAAWRTQLATGEVGLQDHTAHAPTFKEFSEQRFSSYLPGKVKPRTVVFYTDAVNSLNSFAPLASARIHAIDPDLVERYIQHARKNKLMAGSINNHLRCLRRSLHLAVEWGKLRKVPKITLLPASEERNRKFVISEDLLILILREARDGDGGLMFSLLVMVLMDSGLRLSEALNLTWDTVSFAPKDNAERGYIHVTTSKSEAGIRYIPLTGRARGCLAECRKRSKCNYVFTSGNGERKLSAKWASEQFRRIREKLGLPWDCVIHSLRHSFLTRLGEAGADAFSIKSLAGHSSITVSTKYIHPTSARLENVIGMLEAKKDDTESGTPKNEQPQYSP